MNNTLANFWKKKLPLILIALSLLAFWSRWQPIRSGSVQNVARSADMSKANSELPAATLVNEKQTEIYSADSPIIRAARKVGPTVVTIRTTYKVSYREGFGQPDAFDDFFRDFFGEIPRQQQRQSGLGSGVIISAAGEILTNEHVIHAADEILVRLSNGDEYEAEIVAKDVDSDIALLKIEGHDLPYSKIGNSEKLEVGEWVIAIGNPFGFAVNDPHPTVTVGVVSAKNRSIDAGSSPRRHYTNLIQTDAAINPGNSGGPLVNLEGKVVGINSAIFSTSGGYQGIGFAIAINSAMKVKGDLEEFGRVIKPMLGIVLQSIDRKWKEYYDLPDSKGALVIRVVEDSPAAKAGIEEGDVIRALNEKEIMDSNELVRLIQNHHVGDVVELTILRMGGLLKRQRTVKIKVTLKDAEDVYQTTNVTENKFGIQVAELSAELKNRYHLESGDGVVITEVNPSSYAARLGLKAGDLIKEINREQVSDLKTFNKLFDKLKKDELVNIVIIRGGTMYLFRFNME